MRLGMLGMYINANVLGSIVEDVWYFLNNNYSWLVNPNFSIAFHLILLFYKLFNFHMLGWFSYLFFFFFLRKY